MVGYNHEQAALMIKDNYHFNPDQSDKQNKGQEIWPKFLPKLKICYRAVISAKIPARFENGLFRVAAGDAASPAARAKCTKIEKLFWATRSFSGDLVY